MVDELTKKKKDRFRICETKKCKRNSRLYLGLFIYVFVFTIVLTSVYVYDSEVVFVGAIPFSSSIFLTELSSLVVIPIIILALRDDKKE